MTGVQTCALPISTVVSGRKFSFTATKISLANEDFSRSLIKIALTFSRLRGVSIASDSPSIQALKSNGSASAIVGWSSHKSIADSSVLPPLTHGLRLYSDGNGTPLICEVSFFEDIRFVALLLERCDSAVNEQYKYDLVACKSVDLPDGNLQNIHMQTSMIGKSTAPDDIAIVNMRYWMQHQKQLLIQRAIQTAAQEFAQNVHLGIDLGEARRLATEQTNSALAPYGLHLQGDLEIEPM